MAGDEELGSGRGRDAEPAGRASRVARRGLLALAGALLVGALLLGWNRVAASDRFCASCHTVEPAARAAARSVHEELTCLSCHVGPGLPGSIRYLPTLARELVHELTPWEAASGVLTPRPCTSCHTDLASTPETAAAHGAGAKCASCHGDVAHPPYRVAGFARPIAPIAGEDPHPRLYVQTHGADVVRDPRSCATCHEADYCETCHLRERYPHPKGWIELHGPSQQEQGFQACEGCHPQTFCAGCHGTEIPHDVRWLGEHWRALEGSGTESCLLCHTTTDCTTCHARHEVHREQGLYEVGDG